jgi:hypothetical protein
MTIETKAVEILHTIARMCANGEGVTIRDDWNLGTGTLVLGNSKSHSHFGLDCFSEEAENLKSFINGLHNLLVKKQGLSFADERETILGKAVVSFPYQPGSP